VHIASQPMKWKHQSINKQNYDHREINKWKKVRTLLDTYCPNGSCRIVTEPLSASSKTVADPVVLIGTPCLLSYAKKVLDTRSWKPKQETKILYYAGTIWYKTTNKFKLPNSFILPNTKQIGS